jgi:DNA polymerase sigma
MENVKKINNDKDPKDLNPKDSIEDGSSTDFENNGSTKKSHQVMNQNSKKDIIEKNTNKTSRDSL